MNALRGRPGPWHLETYGAIIRDMGASTAMKTALRTRSFAYRHYFARLATCGEIGYEEVRQGAQPTSWDPAWLVALAETMAFQELEPDDRDLAIPLLRRGIELLPEGHRALHQKHLAQLLISRGDWEGAETLISSEPHLQELEGGYLATDLLNPFCGSPFSDYDEWYERFSRVFTGAGFAAPVLEGSAESAFDRLRADTRLPQVIDGPLISVVMTTYASEEEELRTSVLSILHQTWRNLEVILVDDCSPKEFITGLEEIASLDPRIRLVRQAENGGTYLARNAGIRHARGEFVTGQDADDWSHPERLAEQVAPLLADDEIAGSRCVAITTNENLLSTRPGYHARRPNPSSLMFRRDLALETGGFLPARKGADSEFTARLDKLGPKPVVTLDAAPLSIVRIRTDSLSRGDFRSGWSHSARRAFFDSYQHWHATTARSDLKSDEAAPSPVAIPAGFAVRRAPSRHFDVVWIADFRPRTNQSAAREAELRALVSTGLEVAVLHLEDPRYPTTRRDSLSPALSSMMNAGQVTRISEDSPHTASLVVVRNTALLATPPAEPLALDARVAAVVADHLLWENGDQFHSVLEERSVVKDLLGRDPVWVAPTEEIRERVSRLMPHAKVAGSILPGVIDPDHWPAERTGLRSNVPVIGRVAPDASGTWPKDVETLTGAYPLGINADVRVLGGARFAKRVLGPAARNATWVTFTHDEIDLRTFLHSVDFLVYSPDEKGDVAPDPVILEALASGCVAILPPRFAPRFGNAAVYTDRRGAAGIAARLHASPTAYLAQSRRGREFVVQNHTVDHVIDLVRELAPTP